MGTAYGFDTLNYIYNVAAEAKAKFGQGTFYLRYFSPTPWSTVVSTTSAVPEMRAAWDNGAIYLAPICEPAQSRLNGSRAYGATDGAAFCAALDNFYFRVGPLSMPNRLDCYLALEATTNLSNAYWLGWANAVGQHQISGKGAPFYPGMYCNPKASTTNCSTAVGYWCYSVWASEPEPCAACGPFGSVGWQAYTCYNSPSKLGPTLVWQMAEENGCESNTCRRGAFPNVDADMTNPNYSETDHMFRLNWRP